MGSQNHDQQPESNQSRAKPDPNTKFRVISSAIISLANQANGIDAQAANVILLQLKSELTYRRRPVAEQDAQILHPQASELGLK